MVYLERFWATNAFLIIISKSGSHSSSYHFCVLGIFKIDCIYLELFSQMLILKNKIFSLDRHLDAN